MSRKDIEAVKELSHLFAEVTNAQMEIHETQAQLALNVSNVATVVQQMRADLDTVEARISRLEILIKAVEGPE